MVPAGGSHLLHPETARAARILGIDYSDAVTGFSFKGRHGTAVMNGAVVATEFREAVQEVLHAFEDEMADEEALRRSAEALRVWKRLLTGLRIRERINGYEIEGERKALDEKMVAVDEVGSEKEGDESNVGGGFFPDSTSEDIAEPTAGKFAEYSGIDEEGYSGPSGFLTEENLDNIDDQSHNVGGRFADDNESQYNLRNFSSVEEGRSIPSKNLPPEYRSTYENRNEVEGGGYLDEELLEHQHPTQNAFQPAGDLADGHIHGSGEPQQPEHVPMAQETKTPSSLIIQDLNKPTSSSSQLSEQNHVVTTKNYVSAPANFIKTALKGHFADLNLPESELAEARMLQEMHEASQQKSSVIVPSQAVQQTLPLSQPIHLYKGLLDVPISPRSGEDGTERICLSNDDNEGVAGGSNSSSSDAGSLLSHDPEDEDADPEWIA